MQTQQRTHCPIFTQSHLHCFVEITPLRKVAKDPKDDQILLVTMTIVWWVIILWTSYFGDIRTWSLLAGQPFYSEDDDLYFSERDSTDFCWTNTTKQDNSLLYRGKYVLASRPISLLDFSDPVCTLFQIFWLQNERWLMRATSWMFEPN